jgi:hypothetical protein
MIPTSAGQTSPITPMLLIQAGHLVAAGIHSRAYKPVAAGTASCTFSPGWTASSIVIT